MVELDNILIFVKVAEFESITKAALSLGMPISTVSRRLTVLESGLGGALVRRTTRRVTLTPQGREYFNQCREPLTLIQEAERVLKQAQRKPEGTTGIWSAAAAWLGCTYLDPYRAVTSTRSALLSFVVMASDCSLPLTVTRRWPEGVWCGSCRNGRLPKFQCSPCTRVASSCPRGCVYFWKRSPHGKVLCGRAISRFDPLSYAALAFPA